MEPVIGPEAVVEVAVGDVDEGNAPLGADDRRGLGLSVGPLAQNGAQGRHEGGAAVELAGAAGDDVPAAPRSVVKDGGEVISPLVKAATGHEVVGTGAHEEHVGVGHLGQEAVAHTSHGGTQLGVRDPFDVASSAGGDNAGDTRHKGLLLSLDTRAGDERIPHSSQPQRRTAAADDPGAGGGMRSVRRDNALALSRRLRGEAHSTTGDGSLGNGEGAAQCPADTASGCGEGTHVARVYGRAIPTICGIAHTDEGEQSPADA